MILLWLACHPGQHKTTLNDGEHCQQASERLRRAPSSDSPAAQLAADLGRPETFLIGLGNDLDGSTPEQAQIYALPTALDIHYAYLTGMPGRSDDWTTWNDNASFVDRMIAEATAHCTTPMFTLYAMATEGEDNLAALASRHYMAAWWAGFDVLLERLAAADVPVLLHVEPDFWGFAQQAEAAEALPAILPAQCDALPATIAGLGHCIAQRIHSEAPLVRYGLHASRWAGSAEETVRFLTAVGGAEADLVVVETLDRDAGCFEAGRSAHCQREDGPWYWDTTNTRSPNFAEHLDWAARIHRGMNLPLLWWQMPLGRPMLFSGWGRHYRDNRVRYLFGHPAEFVAAGGVGAVFGKGAPDQTDTQTDGGQFARAVSTYYLDPEPL